MKIVILAQPFAPEELSGAVLATELATDLRKLGHDLFFITCSPSYPAGVVFPGYANTLVQKEIFQGVHVIRVWSYITSEKTFLKRFLNYLTFSITAFLGFIVAGKPDVVLCFSPPFFLEQRSKRLMYTHVKRRVVLCATITMLQRKRV